MRACEASLKRLGTDHIDLYFMHGFDALTPVDDKKLYAVVDALDEIAEARGKTITQVALNWLLTRPSVANVVVGARDETQLLQNLGMVGWTLSADDVAKLDAASYEVPVYPYWHQKDSIDGIRSRRPGSSAARAPIDHQ